MGDHVEIYHLDTSKVGPTGFTSVKQQGSYVWKSFCGFSDPHHWPEDTGACGVRIVLSTQQ